MIAMAWAIFRVKALKPLQAVPVLLVHVYIGVAFVAFAANRTEKYLGEVEIGRAHV